MKYPIRRQPDDITCGPTCLQSVYAYFGDSVSLDDVIKEVTTLEGGGTLAVMLGCHALRRGYNAEIYSYNLKIFDPTWWTLEPPELIAKLEAQLAVKKQKKLGIASEAYIEFLRLGGQLKFKDLTSALVGGYLLQGIPILSGLSSTYLYKSAREIGDYPVSDDIKGVPQGHFVVLTSYDPGENIVTVADPYHPDSMHDGRFYRINMEHLVCSILLGVVTYDGNLLIITKNKAKKT